jgi:hypothetical protein
MKPVLPAPHPDSRRDAPGVTAEAASPPPTDDPAARGGGRRSDGRARGLLARLADAVRSAHTGGVPF